MKSKNKGGRPSIDPYLKRTLSVRVSPQLRDGLKALGYDLSDGVSIAIADFIARGKRNEKQ